LAGYDGWPARTVGAGRSGRHVGRGLATSVLPATPVDRGGTASWSRRRGTAGTVAGSGPVAAVTAGRCRRRPHACARAPCVAGCDDGDPAPHHRGRGRRAAVSERRASPATAVCAGGTVFLRAAGGVRAHRPALHVRPRPAALSIPARAGTRRTHAGLVAACVDRAGPALALAGRHPDEGAGPGREGAGA